MPRSVMRVLGLSFAVMLAACQTDDAANAGKFTRYDPGFDAVVDTSARIERLTDPAVEAFTWSEGPAWLPEGRQLLFTDVPENTMYRWTEDEGLSVFLKPSGYDGPDDGTLREGGANGLFAEPDGMVLVADSGNRTVARLDPNTKARTTLASHFDGKRFNSPNDVVRDNRGNVYFTDPPYGLKDGNDSPAKELAFNGVYRVDPDGRVHLLDDSLVYPNGVALSPDERTLYVSNSDRNRPILKAYSLDASGNVVSQRILADVSDLIGKRAPGLPDGLAVAADGTLFATGPGGVLVFAPDGKRLGRIETGSAIANCAFGDDGHTLYMTSDRFLARVRVKAKGLAFAE